MRLARIRCSDELHALYFILYILYFIYSGGLTSFYRELLLAEALDVFSAPIRRPEPRLQLGVR